jgi:hypothetical protein
VAQALARPQQAVEADTVAVMRAQPLETADTLLPLRLQLHLLSSVSPNLFALQDTSYRTAVLTVPSLYRCLLTESLAAEASRYTAH